MLLVIAQAGYAEQSQVPQGYYDSANQLSGKNLKVALQGGEGFVQLPFLRLHLLPECNDFRGDVRPDAVDVPGGLAGLSGGERLLPEALPSLF